MCKFCVGWAQVKTTGFLGVFASLMIALDPSRNWSGFQGIKIVRNYASGLTISVSLTLLVKEIPRFSIIWLSFLTEVLDTVICSL